MKRLILIATGGISLFGLGLLIGGMFAQQSANNHFSRSFTYLHTSDLHQMVSALREVRQHPSAQGVNKLDLLMLQKLSGLGRSTNNAAREYRAQDINDYFQEFYGLAALNERGETPEELNTKVTIATKPPVVQLEPGDPAPDFKLSTINGQPLQLSNLKGKVVLLTFFATWCSPCVAEMNHLTADPIIRNKDLAVVAIGVDRRENETVLKDFVAKHQFPFAFARDTENRDVIKQYASRMPLTGSVSTSIPVTVLIGRDGKMIARTEGFSETSFKKLREQVSSALEQ